MSFRYWSTVAPLVQSELERWERRARTIRDPAARTLALEKLDGERFNAEVAATLATLAPRAQRRAAVEAIVALEVMYDYLDALTEEPLAEVRDSERLFQAFTDAVTPEAGQDEDRGSESEAQDGGYLRELVGAVQVALGQLPTTDVIAEVIQHAARRCAEAQVGAHADASTETTELEDWSVREASASGLGPREFLAGAMASVLAVHALIAAAADQRTTYGQARAIDATYLSISALSTMLDSLIDFESDAKAGKPQYLERYADRDVLARELLSVARNASKHARDTPQEAHHLMTLVGVVAYYTSAPSARSAINRPVSVHIHRELRPLIGPTLAFMRVWRLIKRVRGNWRKAEDARDILALPPGVGVG